MKKETEDFIWKLEKGSKEEKVYKNLERQIERVFKHCRQGSKKTNPRYKSGVKHLAKLLAVAYNKKSMNNISNSALELYVEQAQEAGYSSKYLNTNMSAIRFFIDQIKDSSYVKTNSELGVISVKQEDRIGPNRAWSADQVREMYKIARESGYTRESEAIRLAYAQGLRIHEVTKLDRATLLNALKTNKLTIKGKGGLIRQVPIRNQASRDHIKQLAIQTPATSYKVFVLKNEQTHEVIKGIQNFIQNYRYKVVEPGGHNITYHGLRHTYCQERYKELIQSGKNDHNARLQISRELGHFRIEITNIYLN